MMLSSYCVRNFEIGDLLACQQLFVEGQLENCNPPDYYQRALQTDLADISRHYVLAPGSAFFVAEQQLLSVVCSPQPILGMAGVRPLSVADSDYYRRLLVRYQSGVLGAAHPDQVAEVNRMVVSQCTRKLGIGRLLVESCINIGRQLAYQLLHLTTLGHMRGAIEFYSRCGFVRGNGDGVVWTRTLVGSGGDACEEEMETDRQQGIYHQVHFTFDLSVSRH